MNRRVLISSLCAGGMLAGCGGADNGLGAAVKVGLTTPADIKRNGVYVWLKACTDILERAGFSTRIYPNSSIGGERERVLQLQLGLLEINATGGDEIGRWSALSYAGARPFLVNSYEHMDRLLTETPFLEKASEDFADYGFRLVDLAYTGSMVGLFTRGRPVRSLDDLRQLRLRVLSAADLDLLRAWRVRGVQVAWEEVAQALQTGMVDAYLNPPNVAPMFGHGAVLEYFTDLRMGPAIRCIIVSKRWEESLSPDERTVLERAFAAGRKANREWTQKAVLADRERLEATGIEWVSLSTSERAAWIEASAAIPPGRWETPEATALYRRWIEETREPAE